MSDVIEAPVVAPTRAQPPKLVHLSCCVDECVPPKAALCGFDKLTVMRPGASVGCVVCADLVKSPICPRSGQPCPS